MAVFKALISTHMSNMESSHRVVVVYSGPTADTVTHAGNLVLPKEAAEQLVAIMDGSDEHEIDIREFNYTIKHPLACRRDLFACTADGLQLTERADKGRYIVRRVDGYWALGEKIA